MKLSLAITTTALALSISTLPAQQGGFGGPRGGDQGSIGGPRGGGPGGQGGQFGGPGGGGRGGPPPHPVQTAIDLNNNFIIEAAEIEAAASNLLKQLDRNKDGQLTSDETEPGPPGGRGGQQFGGPSGSRGDQQFGGPRGGDQGRGGFGGQRQGRGGFGPGGGQGGPPPHPLGTAIDTNNDGTMSKEELANAAASLKKLDEDGDGNISHEEARPRHGGRGGRGGFGGRGDDQFGGPRGGQSQFGGPRGGQGQFGGPQGGQGFGGQMPRGGQGGFGAPNNRQGFGGQRNSGQSNPVDRLMSLDRDGDGKVSRSEIPRSLSGLLQADANKDGYITRAEATSYINTYMNNRRGPQGGGSSGQSRPAFDN